MPLDELSEAMIVSWLDSAELSSRTYYAYLSILHGYYVWREWAGLGTGDPTLRVVRPRLRRGLPRPISSADLRVALSQADDRMRVMLTMAAFCGLRCQEIAGVTRDDVCDHLDPPMLYVSAAKGGDERVVPLHPDVESALRRLGMRGSGPVLRSRTGRAYHPSTISTYIAQHLRACDIDATAHQLRHYYGSTVYDLSDADIRLTQELLGHRSITTTAIYAKLSQHKAWPVVQRLRA